MPSAAQNKRATAVGLAITAALALSVPMGQAFEGLVLHPNHKDPAGYSDICYGDRSAERREYTAEECAARIVARQATDYAPAVLKCVPGLADHVRPFAASTDAAYNAGIAAFCRSPMAKKFNAGDWAGGCAAFRGWFIRAGKKVLPGLVRRREAEAQLCAMGAG